MNATADVTAPGNYNISQLFFGIFDLCLATFSYLSACDVSRCSCVSRQWREYIHLGDERLYRSLIMRYISRNRDVEPILCYTNVSISVPLRFHVELLPVDKIVEVLRCANINEIHLQHAGDSEEVNRLFIAFLLLGSWTYPSDNNLEMAETEKLSFNMVLRSAGKIKQEMLTYPKWSLQLAQWKASYYFMISDSKRTKLLESELQNFSWDFRFKHDEVPMDFMYVHFDADHILRSTAYRESNNGELFDDFFAHLFQPWHFPWKIISRRWISADDNGYLDPVRNRIQRKIDILARKLVYKIQVDQYPVLTVSRRDDGLFELENMYVVFTQRSTDIQENVIHLI